MDYNWAVEYPDLQQICTRFNYHELSHPKRFFYKPLPTILQEGPQCGLVALAMCTTIANRETVQELFRAAKELHFTYNGEMFSVNDMATLARKCLPSSQIELYSGTLNCEAIVDFLFHGGALLVPYDSDKNHSPCNLAGHKAHWAAVSGLIEIETHDCAHYVLAKHGKSANVNVWALESLSESNSQLIEFAPDRKQSDLIYKLPEGGLSGSLGLRNKAVMIHSS